MPSKAAVVHSDPEIMGGVPVFVGTRVPVKTLYDYLAAGDPLDDFPNDFPSVTREQAIAALELAREMTEAHATKKVQAESSVSEIVPAANRRRPISANGTQDQRD